MHPLKSVKGIMGYIEIFDDRLIIHPTGIAKINCSTTEITFKNIAKVNLKDATILNNGVLHFAITNEEDSDPPSIFKAAEHPNALVFKNSQSNEIKKIVEYVEAKIQEFSSGEKNAELSNAKQFIDGINPCSIEGFTKFKELTEARDWEGIANLNKLDFSDNLGVSKEFSVLHEYLREGEVVFNFVSGIMSQTETSNSFDFGLNTWLFVLTDKRMLALDHAMLTASVDTQSIRHEKIQSVSASQGLMFGKITVDIGNRSIVVDNCIKSHVKKFSEIANDWLEHREDNKNSQITETSQVDIISEIERLAVIHEKGLIDGAEFSEAKKSLLSKM